MCLCVCEGEGGLNESPTGGNEQAAANHIAHAANDDWRKEGKRGGRALT